MQTENNPVKKAQCDAGWNDPPMFSYESHMTQIKAEKRGNILNKRVAFPLHSDENASISNASYVDPTLPPQPCDLSLLPPPPSKNPTASASDGISKAEEHNSENICDNEDFNEEEALSVTMKNLIGVLDSKTDNENLQDGIGQIRKRLDVIEQMWKDNKFSVPIQQKLLQLSEAIKSGDSEKADHLQKGLMVDHTSLCRPWIAAIRHILHSL